MRLFRRKRKSAEVQPKSPRDEIDELLAADPRASVVEAEPQAWLLTGDA